MRSRAVVAGALGAILVAMAWAWFGPAPAAAQQPTTVQPTGVEFSIAVPGLPSCDTKSGDTTCQIAPGTTFVVDVKLDSFTDAMAAYTGYDILLTYSGVTPVGQPSMNPWPDCAFAVAYAPRPQTLLFGCAAGLPPNNDSTYVGPIGTMSFSCAQSGEVSLVHGTGNTDLGNEGGDVYGEDSPADTLTITCAAGGAQPTPPTPAPQRGTPPPSGITPVQATAQATLTTPAATSATPAAATPTLSASGAGSGGGGVSGSVIAIIIVVAVAGAGVLGVLGWRFLQSRRGTGGDT